FLDRWLVEDDLAGYLDPWNYGRLNTVERVLLAKRIAGEPSKTARHLSDLLRLQPPNVDRLLVLFDTAVKSGALGDENALESEKAKAGRPVLALPDVPMHIDPGAVPQPPAGGGGGFGFGRGGL